MNEARSGTLVAGLQVSGVLIASIVTSLGAVWLLGHMGLFGRNIPQPHMAGDYVRGWIWALGLTALLCVLPLDDRIPLVHVWLVKIAVDLGAMLIYEWHYGLDAYTYFWWGVWGQHASLLPVLGNGTETILRFSALLGYMTGSSYHAMKIVYSFIGLWGCFCFYRAACHYLSSRKPWLLYLVGFTPTVLFWSSILGKDPVIFLGAGLYALGAAGWLRTNRIGCALPAAWGILIAIFVREWYGVIMVAPLLFVVTPRLRHPIQRVLSVTGGVAGMVYAFTLFHRQFLSDGLSSVLPEVNATVGDLAYGGSGQAFHGFHSVGSMILFLPWGVFTVLFRPLPWDIHNAFTVMAALEGSVLLMLAIFAARHWSLRRLRDPVVSWALAYVMCWAVLYGFGGFGNLGMAVRERLEVMPIIVLLALLFGTRRGRSYLDANSAGSLA
ncbi:MAG TPA: hypothetical protein VMD58_08315 [Acidobacteriaceae bacterium]|nr:hypothetical protein [Acidobacteriaceae bacterium]